MRQRRRLQVLLPVGIGLVLVLACTPTKEEQDISDTIAAASATDTPTAEVAALPVDRDAPFGSFCARLGLSDGEYTELVERGIQGDDEDDLFDPWTGEAVADPPPATDIEYTLDTMSTLLPADVLWLDAEVFPCDGASTFCGGAGGMPAGDYYVVGTDSVGAIPLVCPDYPCEYAVALANEQNFQPETELDLFADTRWWYILSDYGDGWAVKRIDSAIGFFSTPTDARVTVSDDEVVWMIPTTEIPGVTGIRLTTYTPAGADVHGTLPTDRLLPPPSGGFVISGDSVGTGEPPATYPPFGDGAMIVLDGGHIVLGPFCDDLGREDDRLWCNPCGLCTNAGGECNLYSRALGAWPQDPGSWTYEGGQAPGAPVTHKERAYHCFCTN